MKEFFEERRLTGSISLNLKERGTWKVRKRTLCREILRIVDKYATEGYRLTLRQLYYQLITADLVPNHDRVYKKIGSVLDDLRYSGMLDWESIEDRGRIPYIPYSVDNVPDALRETAETYRLDRQTGQTKCVEVWTEKDAISGILKRTTQKYHVRLIVNKGYSSSTAMYRAYRRFAGELNAGRAVTVLYFGDHDPSGLDMIRDIRERVGHFLAVGDRWEPDHDHLAEWLKDNWLSVDWSEDFHKNHETVMESDAGKRYEKARIAWRSEVIRNYLHEQGLFRVVPIGLTMDQIREYNPPPNPAKVTDSRAAAYIEQFGPVSWEVDALEPRLMETIVDDAVRGEIDLDLFRQTVEREKEERSEIRQLADSYK